MECKKPCTDFPNNMCESCTAEIESAAIKSAMNMGHPDWMGPFTDKEFLEIDEFLQNNRDLMDDLSKMEELDKK